MSMLASMREDGFYVTRLLVKKKGVSHATGLSAPAFSHAQPGNAGNPAFYLRFCLSWLRKFAHANEPPAHGLAFSASNPATVNRDPCPGFVSAGAFRAAAKRDCAVSALS